MLQVPVTRFVRSLHERQPVIAPRWWRSVDGAPRAAKFQAALEGGHDVLVLISEVWGGFAGGAMRFLPCD